MIQKPGPPTEAQNVYVVWDIENVRPPSSCPLPEIVRKIKDKAKTLGRMKEFVCFSADRVNPSKPVSVQNPSKPSISLLHKRELQESGVSVEEVPDPKPEAADKFILTQLLKIALDEAGANFAVILLSGIFYLIVELDIHLYHPGDRDFSRALSLLQTRGKYTCLIHNGLLANSMKSNADETVVRYFRFLYLED